MMTMIEHDLVIDANVLGDFCRGEEHYESAKELLTISKSHRVQVNKEILNEYKPLIACSMSKSKNKSDFLKAWYVLVDKRCKKRIKDDGKSPKCIERMRRSDFKPDDAKYVRVALKTNSKILIAREHHFQMAKTCIETCGIKLYDWDEANQFLKQ